MWELQVKFYLRQNEDSSPGDSTSDNSEISPKRQKEGQYIYDFCEGRVHAIKHIFSQKISANLMRNSHHHEGF